MKYHYEKPKIYLCKYGSIYRCNHPIYDKCTLFEINNKGISIIQQRFDFNTKQTWWSEIDPWLIDAIYLHPQFKEYFDSRSSECSNGLYPTITIRQVMWALKMKPIKKEVWETCFDRRNI